MFRIIMGLEDKRDHYSLKELFDLPQRKEEYTLPYDVKTLRQPYLRTDVGVKKLEQIISHLNSSIQIVDRNYALLKSMLKQYDIESYNMLIGIEQEAQKEKK